MPYLYLVLSAIAAYLIGSIPTAYIFGKILKGIDIRQFGSGNMGATNALRVLGKPAGITVLILDIFKGFIPVIVLGNFLSAYPAVFSAQMTSIIIGISCISGHNWTVFLGFKGGKGVASTLGVLLAIAYTSSQFGLVLLLVLSCWVVIFLVTRIVSLASILAAISLPIFIAFFMQSKEILLLGIILSFFVILRHRSNIARICQGREKRISFGKK